MSKIFQFQMDLKPQYSSYLKFTDKDFSETSDSQKLQLIPKNSKLVESCRRHSSALATS